MQARSGQHESRLRVRAWYGCHTMPACAPAFHRQFFPSGLARRIPDGRGVGAGLDHRIGHPGGSVPFAKRAKMAQAQGIYEIKPLYKFSPSGRRGNQGRFKFIQLVF